MGRFSIRLKITIWFTAALVVIVLFAYLMIFVVSRQILIKTIQDSLVETVENNVDEIEYFSGMDEIRTDADIDYLIDYRKGYLEIDDDFLSKVNEVYTGLYDEKSRLIYGENPIAAKVADLELDKKEIPIPMTYEEGFIEVFKEYGDGDLKGIMIYVDINTESYLIRLKNKSVRKDCTIPAWMDDEVKKYGISCSKVLQNALAMKIAGEREKDNIGDIRNENKKR